ncbi:MAG: mannonate dehydratase [Christensenellaceae bacterium]|jgi:mannonate dehydratase|nr:mannonate dehydratase [Christensenellaceae bacterium]
MKLGLAYFGGFDQAKVDLQKQMGLKYVISGAGRSMPGSPSHAFRNLLSLKKSFEDAGLALKIIEGPPMLDDVKLGLPGADEQLANFIEFVQNCGRLGIETICYNWMPVLNWFRSSMALPNRGGATVTGFDYEDVKNAPDTWAGKVPKERLWGTLEGFIKAVIPVCEEAGVNLALHPDDPPIPELMGIGRILTSKEAFDRVLSFSPSKRNGITFCQGCFSTMGEDVPSTIRHFKDRIYFVHFRDIQGNKWKFNESFHDDGITDMVEAMRAYYDIGFEGIARPDHVPTMIGEDNSKPSYGLAGNLFAVGYIKGLIEAVEKERKR